MSNKVLKFTTAAMLHLGVILSLEGDMGRIQSHLLGSAIADGITDPYTATVHVAEESATMANYNLALGIAMILIGMGLHAWMVNREERPVKVRVKKTKKKAGLFWMRVHI